jgi:hypothetical protein
MRWPKYIYLNPFFRLCSSKSSGNYVFVVGAPRSGTTLVANIISNHRGICSLRSETGLFSWRESFLLFEGKAGRNSYEYNKLRKECPNVVQLFDEIAADTMMKSGCARFLEKTPQHVFHIGFILEHFPKSTIVNVVRNPKDAFVSSRANKAVVQNTPASFAKYWRRCIEARRRYSDREEIVDVHYECLVRNPTIETKRIMAALGESFEPEQISPAMMRDDPRAGSQQFRHLGGAITTASVGRWKAELSENEVQIIDGLVSDIYT